MSDELLEPLLAYKSVLLEKHNSNVIHYFDDLVKKSHIDINKNRSIVRQYNNLVKEKDHYQSRKSLFITLQIISIIVSIFFLIVGSVAFYRLLKNENEKLIGGFISAISFSLFLFLLIFSLVFFRKKIRNTSDAINDLEKKAKKQLSVAWESMADLNKLYEWNIPARIINKDTDLIVLDNIFEQSRFDFLKRKYGFSSNEDETSSTLDIQSGTILGNPFLLCKSLNQSWINVT